MTVDPYRESGEFLDVLSAGAWRLLRDPVREALRGAAPQAGPVVDVGAGSGLGIGVLAEAVPDAEILAVEPSPVLRAALLARVAADPGLRTRVTVLAADALGASFPERLGAVVAINMIGHLPPADRRRFWDLVGERLAPGAPLVVNLQPPAEAVAVPETVFTSVSIGRHTYAGSGGARPSGPGTVTWRMRYRTVDEHGQPVHDSVTNYEWHVLSPSDLLDELSDAGFDARVGPLDVVRAIVKD